MLFNNSMIVVLAMALTACGAQPAGENRYSEYSGSVSNFDVETRPNREGLTLKLYPRNPQTGHRLADYAYIGGDDTNDDGAWDVICRCGLDKNSEGKLTGCNAVRFDAFAGWIFEPCPGDKGKVKAFDAFQIKDMVKQLDDARLELHRRGVLRKA